MRISCRSAAAPDSLPTLSVYLCDIIPAILGSIINIPENINKKMQIKGDILEKKKKEKTVKQI